MPEFPSGDNLEVWEVLDRLTSLVEKSLVIYEGPLSASGGHPADGGGGEARYWLLEMVSKYARDRLVESGEAEAVRRQHARFFLAWVEAGVGLERLEEEHGNLRAALEWMADAGAAELGLRLAVALAPFWGRRGYMSEGQEQLGRLLALPGAGEDVALRVRALTAAGTLARSQGDIMAARALFEECLAIQLERGDKAGMAYSYFHLGILARDYQADYERARSLYEQSLALCRELDDNEGIAAALNDLGYTAYLQGDYQTGWALLHESLATRREVGDTNSIGWTVTHLAEVADALGDAEGAAAFLAEGFAIWHELDYNYAIAWTLRKQGRVEQHGGRWKVAGRRFAESLALCRDLGTPWGSAECLEGLAEAAAAEGCAERACRLFGAAEALREAGGWPLAPVYRAEYEQHVAAVRVALGNALSAAAWAEGRAMPADQAIAYALQGSDAAGSEP